MRWEAGEASAPEEMTREAARALLGVDEGASFEAILARKKALAGDAREAEIEAAYDTLLMASLMRRQGGEVAGDVRFADVPPSKPPAQVARELLDKIPGGGVGVEVAGAGSDTSNAKNAVFLGMAIFALLPAAAAPGAPLAGPPALQLGVAGLASVYFLREVKRLNLRRGALLTLGGLVAGVALGGVLGLPFGGIEGENVQNAVLGEAGLGGMWLACTFLV